MSWETNIQSMILLRCKMNKLFTDNVWKDYVYWQTQIFALVPLHFFLNPCHNYIYKIFLLYLAQFFSRLHFMPLPDALSATCCRCMLGNKYRMTTHWCLLAIIYYICRSFSFCDKVLCMLSDRIQSFFVYVINILLLQMETASELGIIQSFK